MQKNPVWLKEVLVLIGVSSSTEQQISFSSLVNDSGLKRANSYESLFASFVIRLTEISTGTSGIQANASSFSVQSVCVNNR